MYCELPGRWCWHGFMQRPRLQLREQAPAHPKPSRGPRPPRKQPGREMPWTGAELGSVETKGQLPASTQRAPVSSRRAGSPPPPQKTALSMVAKPERTRGQGPAVTALPVHTSLLSGTCSSLAGSLSLLARLGHLTLLSLLRPLQPEGFRT